MINKIIQMKERGERVVLELVVSHDDYVNKNHVAVYEREAIAKSSLVVTSVLGGGAALELEDTYYCIPEIDYKYFKIKEPTFNDLIEVAKKAVQDDILSSFTVNDMDYSDLIGRAIYIGLGMRAHRIANEIKRIQSLYTETFVIERESDMKKIKGSAESIMLVNGEDVGSNIIIHNDEPHFFFDNAVVPAVFKLLKGATVTQEVSK